MDYQFAPNPIPPIKETLYRNKLMKQYRELLVSSGDDELVFQTFFEQHPSMVPGAKTEFAMGGSGHGPVYETLITQPNIAGIKSRKPDFLWLSYDSIAFCPVFVEIEAPNKPMFNKDGSFSHYFNKAREQLVEWDAIMSDRVNIAKFVSDYSIPNDVSDLRFEPYYLLIYGRRNELGSDKWLKHKRASIMSDNRKFSLMSFDRIEPTYYGKSFICSEVKAGRYLAKCLSPVFKLGVFSFDIIHFEGLDEAVNKMAGGYVTEERKVFLKNRIPYWLNYHKSRNGKNAESAGMISFSLADLDKQFEE